MGLKQAEETIDDLKFTSTQFPAMRALPLLGRLVKTIGPAIAVLSEAKLDSDMSELAAPIALALKDLDPNAVTALACEILASTSVILVGPQGAANIPLSSVENINIAFEGRLMTMFKVLGFAVKLNFADFFAGSAQSAVALPVIAPPSN